MVQAGLAVIETRLQTFPTVLSGDSVAEKKKDLQRLLSSVKSRRFCRPRQMIGEKLYISLMMVKDFRTYHLSLITTSGDLLFKAAAERKIPSQRCTSIVRRDEGVQRLFLGMRFEL